MVLLVSYSGAFGGAERLLLDFAGGLDRSCTLACPSGRLADEARTQGIAVFPLPGRSLRLRRGALTPPRALVALARHGCEIRRLARDLSPDLVIAWGMRSAIAAAIGPRPRCPLVFQHNDLLPGPRIGRVVRAAAARAEMTIALSHAIADDLDPGRKLGGRLHVVHPGVAADRFSGAAPPLDPPVVLMLGAIAPWKRPDLALDACARARRRHPALRLRIVGEPLAHDDPGFPQELRDRVAELDWAELPGAVADPASELERAHCLLHCAEREPFGMAVLEALAAGRPAVVPAAAGPAEIVDPSCGLLYAPGDAEAAAAALDQLLSDPSRAAELGEHGRERARRQFSLPQARASYAEALRPLLPADPRRPDPGLALVTVTHNSAPELRTLIASVHRHLPGVELVVIDCDSRDETVQVASSEHSVTVVSLRENAGFGRGCNRGLGEVRAPVAALINPDVELLDDSLLALAGEAARRDRPERLLAPLVLYPDGSRQDTVHPVPASPADLVRSVIPPAAIPGRLRTTLAPWRSAQPRRVGWAVGCALVAKTETLRQLGPFDERIFLYGEDLELGLRAAARGIETWFWPAARIVHHRAHSTASAFGGEPFTELARARHEVVARRLGARRARYDDAAQAVTFASRGLMKRLLGRSADRERHQLDAVLRVRR